LFSNPEQWAAMDQVFCMKMFARVLELQSFSRASEEFDVARSTATEAVADLEKRLGVRLLHRTTRKLTPTEDGRAYYENCVRILADLHEAEESLTSAKGKPRGKLRVSTPHGFVRMIFFPELPQVPRPLPRPGAGSGDERQGGEPGGGGNRLRRARRGHRR
jgi:LysR family transcriptional regulator for bpeEF and oprC